MTNAEGKQEVRLNPSRQVVMPMEGFFRAFEAQDPLISCPTIRKVWNRL